MADHQTINRNHAMSSSSNPTNNKKTKMKKSDMHKPLDISEKLQQAISQIESKQAGDREQDQEIEREVKKQMRETTAELKTHDGLQEKLDVILDKYRDLMSNMKRLERDYKITKKRADQTQKERDSVKIELHKLHFKQDKLENLAKTFQKSNKELRSQQEIEVKKRNELSNQLEILTKDVEVVLLQKVKTKSEDQLLNTDEMFKQKFKSFVDQYELRELHYKSILRQRELERNYHLNKLEQHRKDQHFESSKSNQLTKQVSNFSQTETELRGQLNVYVEKFKQVEDTLNSSNELFLTFRKEMEEMSKKTKRLEKENNIINRKHEATNQNVIRMVEERNKMQKELSRVRQKNENLIKLCRGMQEQGRTLPNNTENYQDSESEVEDLITEDDEESDEVYNDLKTTVTKKTNVNKPSVRMVT